MTMRYGSLVGHAYSGASAVATPTSSAHENGTDHIIARDTIELAAAPANDTIFLARVPSNTVLDPDECRVWFDDLGTSVTMDVGDSSNVDGLADGVDVATAAGSFNLMVTVNIADFFKPVWQQLGYAADPGGYLDLYATILGAAATGTVSWQIKGQAR